MQTRNVDNCKCMNKFLYDDVNGFRTFLFVLVIVIITSTVMFQKQTNAHKSISMALFIYCDATACVA